MYDGNDLAAENGARICGVSHLYKLALYKFTCPGEAKI